MNNFWGEWTDVSAVLNTLSTDWIVVMQSRPGRWKVACSQIQDFWPLCRCWDRCRWISLCKKWSSETSTTISNKRNSKKPGTWLSLMCRVHLYATQSIPFTILVGSRVLLPKHAFAGSHDYVTHWNAGKSCLPTLVAVPHLTLQPVASTCTLLMWISPTGYHQCAGWCAAYLTPLMPDALVLVANCYPILLAALIVLALLIDRTWKWVAC